MRVVENTELYGCGSLETTRDAQAALTCHDNGDASKAKGNCQEELLNARVLANAESQSLVNLRYKGLWSEVDCGRCWAYRVQ